MSRFYARNGAGDLLARYSFIEPLLPGKRVLEVGAAGATSGASALFLAERGAALVVSVEEDLAAIEEAAQESRHPFVQFKAVSLEALPEKAFDLILVADGAALAVDPARVASLFRLLSPRGRLVSALPAPEPAALAELAGEPAEREAPTFESFVGALGDHFTYVEVATQSATVGYVVAMGQEAEPEVSIDGSLAGTSETAWYVAVCGEAPCNLSGLTIVALPTQPLFEAAAERDRLAATGGTAAEAARSEVAAALAERDAAGAEREAALGELEALRAERDAAVAAVQTGLDARAARIQELEAALDAEREANFDLRAAADKALALEAERAEEQAGAAAVLAARDAELTRAVEERSQALAELSALKARAEEIDAALRGARAETQAARAAVESALERATSSEARTHDLEEGAETQAAILDATKSRLATSEAELAALRAELAAVKAEGSELAGDRELLRDRGDAARALTEELQGRIAELEVRGAEVDRLNAELSRRDDDAAEANEAQEILAAQLAELAARLETGEERLREAEAQAAEAKAQLEADRRGAESVSDRDTEVEKLTGELERVKAQAAQARDGADAAEGQAAELEAELQAVRWEKDELEQRLQAVQQAGAASSGAEVGRLREEVALRSARIVELEHEVVRLGAMVDELTSQPSVGTSPLATGPAADARVEELEEKLADARRRAAEAEAHAAARANEPEGGGSGEGAKPADRLKEERDSLQAQVAERDARLARLQREVLDKTERLGRLAKEMGELKAKGIGKIFR